MLQLIDKQLRSSFFYEIMLKGGWKAKGKSKGGEKEYTGDDKAKAIMTLWGMEKQRRKAKGRTKYANKEPPSCYCVDSAGMRKFNVWYFAIYIVLWYYNPPPQYKNENTVSKTKG